LIAAVITLGILAAVYRGIDNFYNLNFSLYLQYKTIAFTVLFSLITVLTYQIMAKLTSNLFIKGKAAREAELKKFSLAVNQTLDLREVQSLFMDFIADNMPGAIAYYCALDEKTNTYHIQSASHGVSAKDFSLPQDHPVISWFEKNKDGIYFKDFSRTSAYKAMWEKEKDQLHALNVDYLLPIVCDDDLVGIALFTNGNRRQSFSFTETNFLESVAAVFSISVKNARMYVEMRREARIDALTGLYNRKHFMETAQAELEKIGRDSYVLALLDLDDFHLYNELYGTKDGDEMLKTFAGSSRPSFRTPVRWRGTAEKNSSCPCRAAIFRPPSPISNGSAICWPTHCGATRKNEEIPDVLRRSLRLSDFRLVADGTHYKCQHGRVQRKEQR
jgi:GGDEF domain-containing protein